MVRSGARPGKNRLCTFSISARRSAFAVALIGYGCIKKAVTEHHGAAAQGRVYNLLQMLDLGSGVEKKLSQGDNVRVF